MSLKDKVCIMTGGGDGIGRATALKMAGEGAKLSLVGRTASKVEAVKAVPPRWSAEHNSSPTR